MYLGKEIETLSTKMGALLQQLANAYYMRKLFSKKIVPVCALSKLFGVPSNFRTSLEKPKKKIVIINPKQTTICPFLGYAPMKYMPFNAPLNNCTLNVF